MWRPGEASSRMCFWVAGKKSAKSRPYWFGVGLQQFAEFLDRQPGVLHNPTHCEGLDWIVSRNSDLARAPLPAPARL